MTEEKPERIVIDLSRATYIDSAGLAADSSHAKGSSPWWQVFPGWSGRNYALDFRDFAA